MFIELTELDEKKHLISKAHIIRCTPLYRARTSYIDPFVELGTIIVLSDSKQIDVKEKYATVIDLLR